MAVKKVMLWFVKRWSKCEYAKEDKVNMNM
jgi:hypothetical protein